MTMDESMHDDAAPEKNDAVEASPAAPSFVTRIKAAVLKTVLRCMEYMLSREFRPVPTVIAVTAIVILLGLGTWQLIRLSKKNAMLALMETRLHEKPVVLNGGAVAMTVQDWQNLHYRPVIVKGRFMPLFQFKLAPRTYEGQVGYQLIVPIELENRQIILVNRGFVADGIAMLPPSEDSVTLQGIARIPEQERPAYRPENIPSRGLWAWLDLEAMGHEIGVRNMAPVIVYETKDASREAYPIGGQLPLPSHNRHWHYAVTWYCLALALIGVWIMSSSPKQAKAEEVRNDNKQDVETMDPVARRALYPEATD